MSEKISRYEIKTEIGRGGMATVYRAYDPRFKRSVAIKILPQELLHNPTFRARFEREAQTVASLEHPAIVPVHDFGEQDGQPFLVMRYMTGGSLADRLARGAVAVSETARILARLAPALDSAHSLGIIHRDLKPGNILFDQWNEPYLSDFGIVKLVESEGSTLTATGGIVGTPAYMSPEQVMGGSELDGRSDIYALGVITYEMLTGARPYEADTPMALAFKHVNAPLPRIFESNPKLSPNYQAIIEKALAKDRDQRFATAAALAEAVIYLAQKESTLESPAAATQVEESPVAEELESRPSSGEQEGTQIAPAPIEKEKSPPAPAEPVPAPSISADETQIESEAEPVDLDIGPDWDDTEVAPQPIAPSPPIAGRPSRKRLLGILAAVAGLLLLIGLCAAGVIFGSGLLDDLGGQADDPTTEPPASQPGVIGSFVAEKWDEGFEITSLAFGQGVWGVVMSEGVGVQQQSLQRQSSLPSEFIDRKWAEGFEITSLAFGDNQWTVVMSRGIDPQRQTLNAEADFPSQYIDQKWAEGLDLVRLAYGNGLWTVVMAEKSNDFRQSIWRESTFPSEFIDRKWAEGFEITGLAYGNGEWVVVMSEGVGNLRQTLWREADFPGQFIDEKWAEDFEITNLAYGEGAWVVVMSQGVAPQRQTLRTGGW